MGLEYTDRDFSSHFNDQKDFITLTPLCILNIAQMNHFDSEAVLISGSSGFGPVNPETRGA